MVTFPFSLLSPALARASRARVADLVPEAPETRENGGHDEDKGDEDEEDEEAKGKDGRLLDFRKNTPAGLGSAVDVVPAKLLQRLCWLGKQFEHLLLERAHTQNLHDPALLQPQHFGIAVLSGLRVLGSRFAAKRWLPQECLQRVVNIPVSQKILDWILDYPG